MKPEAHYIYIAFDLFPSQKGAATHINHCLKALENTFEVGIIIWLGNDDMSAVQYDAERNLYVYRFKEKIINFIERTTAFQKFVDHIVHRTISKTLKVIHFRDIWRGLPVLKNLINHQKSHLIKTIFEVNSFASIELPSRYPSITKGTLHKISILEKYLLRIVLLFVNMLKKSYAEFRISIF